MVKGIVYTLEAAIGTVIVLLGIITIFPIQSSRAGLSDVGYNCLSFLGQNGSLRQYAESGMLDQINISLSTCIPSVMDFTFMVCSTADCIGSLPSGKTIYASSYVIAGYDTYNKKLINLWMWMK